MSTANVPVYRTWTPRTFALVIWSGIIPILAVLIVVGIDAVGQWPRHYFMAVFMAPFAAALAVSRLAGVTRGTVAVDREGLWWARGDLPGSAAPLVRFAGLKSWWFAPSLYGRFVPLVGQRHPLILRFETFTGERMTMTLVFRDPDQMGVMVEAIKRAVEDASRGQGVIDGTEAGARRRSWLEGPWRSLAGVGLILLGLVFLGSAVYYFLVKGSYTRPVRWVITGIVAVASGVRLLWWRGGESASE